ncbi:MAG: crossover junction endodeoxyribonuclease RuvC [Rhodospirillaceae bacterium]|nr:crossover junction endodeoxyribonuclease RuvC [Rhodospirillaceae bacterium]OUX27533.1 MAG: crossover junction endodeoxyribonuclease RuvC [Rhodospirillaceae bacterium TMED256]
MIGLDPGLQNTGWGIIDIVGNRLSHVADGTVRTIRSDPLACRLRTLHEGLAEVLNFYEPDESAVEETFVNKNPTTTLKLGEARGVVLLAPSLVGLPVAEYSANRIKKSVVGVGHAGKSQVQMMVQRLLPGCDFDSADSADALAVAICHSHFVGTERRWAAAEAGAKM